MLSRLCAIAFTLLAVIGAPAVASAQPADAALSCWTTTYNTVGKGTCDNGPGTWKVQVNCHWQVAQSSGWINQRSGRTNLYAECISRATGTFIHIR